MDQVFTFSSDTAKKENSQRVDQQKEKQNEKEERMTDGIEKMAIVKELNAKVVNDKEHDEEDRFCGFESNHTNHPPPSLSVRLSASCSCSLPSARSADICTE